MSPRARQYLADMAPTIGFVVLVLAFVAAALLSPDPSYIGGAP